MGFNVVTRIADDYKMQITIKEHKALCAKGFIGGKKVLLALPQTYMNLSGESIRELVNYYKTVSYTHLLLVFSIILRKNNLCLTHYNFAFDDNG